ncbi:hypothetical protein K7432_009754 [Basidiobolus ranarum]|uniref:Peptide transporter n=1 Tax=Basidiobolus ranarum TaxID=34480 RepID=A0ABR2VWJ9_9FUNG
MATQMDINKYKQMEIGAANESYLIERENEPLCLEQELNVNLGQKPIDNLTKTPKAIWYIIPTMVCGNFASQVIYSFLFTYLVKAFGLDFEQTKAQLKNFNTMNYLFPLLGAIISDSWLTRYHSIVYFSIIYFIGIILMAVFSIDGLVAQYGSYPVWTIMLPLVLVAFGTSGTQPTLYSHGGDQYLPHQTAALDWYFALVYLTVNIGALLAQFMPLLNANLVCWGAECYFASFTIPAIPLGVALIVFIVGFKHYRVVPAIGEFLPWKALKGIVYAVKKYKSATSNERRRRGNWLNFAEEQVGPLFIEEIRMLGKVLGMMLPITFFRVIYHQQVWTQIQQYDMMNKSWGSIVIATEQSFIFSIILPIIFVPICTKLLYPYLERRGIRFYLLRRMAVGFSLIILSLSLSYGLQHMVILKHEQLSGNYGRERECPNCLHGAWQLPQWILLALGEAMVAPSGLQFAYTQVGPQMKSTSSAFWMILVSLDNLIRVAINNAWVDESLQGTSKYIFYCGIGLAANIVFCFLATKYTYKEDRDAETLAAAIERKEQH